MYFITTKRMLEVCFSAHPNIQYRTLFSLRGLEQISFLSLVRVETSYSHLLKFPSQDSNDFYAKLEKTAHFANEHCRSVLCRLMLSCVFMHQSVFLLTDS